jgi:iron(II)-dependent oxidoreductase
MNKNKLLIFFTIVSFLLSGCLRKVPQNNTVDIIEQEMILIPSGEFIMGIDEGYDNSPAHNVKIDSFYLDKYEITNAHYQKFCEETNRQFPEFWGMEEFRSGPDFPNHPVTGVSWRDAAAFAKWAGKRLPTEAEWEYAARGGLVGVKYPFGDEIDSTKANYFIMDAVRGCMPVGSFAPNGFGLYDMCGNVVEWVADFYTKDYYSESEEDNPAGPAKGKFKVIRGGGWHSGPMCSSVYFRNAIPGGWKDINVGFRCVKDIE